MLRWDWWAGEDEEEVLEKMRLCAVVVGAVWVVTRGEKDRKRRDEMGEGIGRGERGEGRGEG